MSNRETYRDLGLNGAFVLILGASCVFPTFKDRPTASVLVVLVGTSWVAVGTLLRGEPRSQRLGFTMLICGLLWVLQEARSWDVGPLPLVSTFASSAFWATACFGVLSFPLEFARSRAERVFPIVIAIYLFFSTLIGVLVARPEWFEFSEAAWWPSLASSRTAFDLTMNVTVCLDASCALVFTILITRRLKRLSALDRRTIFPFLWGFCFLAIASAILIGWVGWFSHDSLSMILSPIGAMLIPLGFWIANFRTNKQRLETAERLQHTLNSQIPDIAFIEQSLRDGLFDNTIEVLMWDAALGTFVDRDGTSRNDVARGGRAVRYINSSVGGLLAAVVTNDVLESHPKELSSALLTTRLALENASLYATTNAQLLEVRQSRERIAKAAALERRRIERDIHDGVQQLILAAGARLGVLRQAIADQDVIAKLDSVTNDIRDTQRALREFAHRIHPAELRQFGLGAAIRVVVESLDRSADVAICSKRYPPEATAYFVVCESLTNVVKHASSSMATVSIEEVENMLKVIVSDDGIGGAVEDKGTGIVGLRDRVNALGGSLDVNGNGSSGTTVKALIPCG